MKTLKTGLGFFKIIENGTVRYTIYDFLLVCHCKYSSILYRRPFLSYLMLDNIVTLKCGLEVTQDHSNWYYSKAWMLFPIRCFFHIPLHSMPHGVPVGILSPRLVRKN